MARWGEGYLTDLAYTTGFFRETTPHWLSMVALLRGQYPPDLTRPFHYADLGCGTGFTAIVVAASMPQAEVWGFDFNPAHIEAATRLAQAAGLPNVHFREASFAELAALPDGAIPDFDFIVSHGVFTHVSEENRRLLLALIDRWLKPGGLVYLGYNVAVGWAGMEPARQVLRMLAGRTSRGTPAGLEHMPEWMTRFRTAGSRYLAEHPGIDKLVAGWQQADPRYIAHEYLGEAWLPLLFAEVADAMAAVQCTFVGSATLIENVDALSLPAGCVSLVASFGDVRVQESLRDFARGQTFRRDIYRRGSLPLLGAERGELLDRLEFHSLGWPAERSIALETPLGTVADTAGLCQPALSAAASGQVSFRQLRAAAVRHGQTAEDALLATLMLVAVSAITPTCPVSQPLAAQSRTTALNRALIQAALQGAELRQLVAPAVGVAVASDLTEMTIVGQLLAGAPAQEDLVAVASELLAASRRRTADFAAGNAAGANATATGDPIDQAMRKRVPLLRRLGILGMSGRTT